MCLGGKHSTLDRLKESLSLMAYPFLNEVKFFEITPVYKKKPEKSVQSKSLDMS